MATASFSFRSDGPQGDVFTVVAFRGSEGMSRLFRYEIDLKAPVSAAIDLDDMLDNTARLITVLDDGTEYPVNGMLAEFDERQTVQGYTYYKAVLVPRVWKLSIYRTNEIYTTEKTVDQIIATVLEAAGFSSGFDFDIRGLTGTFLQRDYICQFRESDMDFLARLMENEGIYYYFQQKPDGETMIIANGSQYYPLPEPDAVFDAGLQHESRGKTLHGWICRKQRLPLNVTVRDYNPAQPSLDVAGRFDVDMRGSGTEYLYGDHFADEDEAGYLAEIRAEEMSCRKTRYYGEGSIPGFTAGYLFNLASHPNDKYNNTKYLLLEVEHEASGLDDAAVSERAGGPRYENTFVAMPADIQFRPALITPKPRFYGTMTAFVYAEAATGQAEVDEFGRYRVHLPFDRAEGGRDSNDPDRKASAWVRMAQPYAGENEGMFFPLRGGTEVLLTFINGDPDRPIISGAVPNASMPSLLTSDNSTESTIGTAAQNRIRFEDRSGSARIVMQTPSANSWIRVGMPNDPPADAFELNGPSIVYLNLGEDFSDPNCTPAAASVDDGGFDANIENSYTYTYTAPSGRSPATVTRTVVVRDPDSISDVDDDTSNNHLPGIRISTGASLWLESGKGHADYYYGIPGDKSANPPVPGDAAQNLQKLIDNFGSGGSYNPSNLKAHGSAVGAAASATTVDAAIEQGHLRVSRLDTFTTQEGNIYDFGGYWNYNLGNSYAEDHIPQSPELNANHSLDWPANTFNGDWGEVATGYAVSLVIGGTAIGGMVTAIGAAPEASPFVIAAVGLGAAFIGTGIWSSAASDVYSFSGNVGDVIWGPAGSEDTSANGDSDTAKIKTWAERVKSSFTDPTDPDSSQDFATANGNPAMNKNTTWVQKNIGDSYDFRKGNAIEITVGHTESHSRGDTYEFVYAGTHEETKYNGDGIQTSWEKSGQGISQEMHFDPQNGALLSYEFKNRNFVNFDFSAQLPSAPKFIVSVSIAPMTFKVDVSVGVSMTIKANIALDMIMDFSKTATFELVPFKALYFKATNSGIDTNIPALEAKLKTTLAEQKVAEFHSMLTDVKNSMTTLENEATEVSNKITDLKNSGITMLN